jgi:methyltransferase-like protein
MTDFELVADRYNEVPYTDNPYQVTHPRRLETMATLFGMTPAPIGTSRVLELGCAGGGNLIPQAQDSPRAEFVGVDFSERQIADGEEIIGSLGLKNIRLMHRNIIEIDDSLGQFDYIICHGVYSWVPPEVQDKILAVCRRNLGPQGVAVISYNTYPGWHLKGMVREMMQYHASQFKDAKEQIYQAQALLEFMVETGNEDRGVVKFLKEELQSLRKTSNSYLFHEHLETHNLPCYFHEFAKRLAERNLQYLGDSVFGRMLLQALPEKSRNLLKDLPMLQQEQYKDFLQNQTFRSSLLCHQEITLDRRVTPDKARPFHVGLTDNLDCPKDLDIRDTRTFTLQCPGKGKMTVGNRMVKSAILCLKKVFPNYVPFGELRQAALGELGLAADDTSPETGADVLGIAVMSAFGLGVFDICVHPPACATQWSGLPEATPLARYQAQTRSRVTNLRHEIVDLDDLSRHVVRRLDGRHDISAIVDSLEEAISSGKMTVRKQGQVVEGVDATLLSNIVDGTLARISQMALLVA